MRLPLTTAIITAARRRGAPALVLAALTALAALSPSAQAAPAVSVCVDQRGVQALTYNGFDFAQTAEGDFGLALRFPNYTVAEWDRRATDYGFQAPDTLVRSGLWGQASCQVTAHDASVTFNVRLYRLP